ncbi:hypothetical protein [Arsenicibacter rosenii]|uniref:Uncharacterized protein n=1 Tax=Arsenicibacter rosenii TaxID=1750698 RepID=A0A1S2VM52_9BACT|nr:hypothetical protein [Arsenicibacter rosenii]OIN59842.1 hypothetical protein BLX24_08260 [Arsenicibacter rosenii]
MTRLEEIQIKREFYKKLTKKLERIAQGELTLTDYIAEVGEKLERLDSELMEMIGRQMQLDSDNNRSFSFGGGDFGGGGSGGSYDSDSSYNSGRSGDSSSDSGAAGWD